MSDLVSLVAHADRVSAVAWLPDGRLVSASFDGTLKLWDVAKQTVSQTLPGQGGLLFAVAADASGKWLAAGGKDGAVRLWSLDALGSPKVVANHAKAVFRLAFSPDGKWLASCGEDDGRVLLVDVAQGKMVKQCSGEDPDDKNQRRSQFGLAFHPDGRLLASCGADRMLRLFDLETTKEARRMAAVDYTLFKEKDKKIDREVKQGASDFALYAVRFSPDGQRLAAGGLDKTIRLWDAATGELRTTILHHAGFVQDIDFMGDGSRLLSSGQAGHVQIWNAADGKLIWAHKLPALCAATALAPDGSRVAAAGTNGTVYLLTLPR